MPDEVPGGNVTTIGNAALLDLLLTALFCSQRIPGTLILPTYDLIRALRDRSVPLIGGFQTPLEAECLTLLLRGTQAVVCCPNRGIAGMRLPPVWREPVAAGRLLLASPFPPGARRKTKELAGARNRFVVEHAARVLVPHAHPGGGAERAALHACASGKPLFTIDHVANAHLIELGAIALPGADLAAALVGSSGPGIPLP